MRICIITKPFTFVKGVFRGMPDFSSRFRELRKERKLTQREMAEVLGVGLRVVNYYEHGGRHPDFKGLLFIAEYFQVSLDYLVGWSDQREIRKGPEQ